MRRCGNSNLVDLLHGLAYFQAARISHINADDDAGEEQVFAHPDDDEGNDDDEGKSNKPQFDCVKRRLWCRGTWFKMRILNRILQRNNIVFLEACNITQ